MEIISSFFSSIVVGWSSGTVGRRAVYVLAVTAALTAILGQVHVHFITDPQAIGARIVSSAKTLSFSVAIVVGAGIFSRWRPRNEAAAQDETRIRAAEERARAHPKETRAAWELAREKLELYLDKNLAHIESVFRLARYLMIAGFLLIGVGVYIVYLDPGSIAAAALPAAAGVCTNFIAATVIALHRSILAQARDHVQVLERINAVGMSLSVVEKIESDEGLRNSCTAELVRLLLSLYRPTGSSPIGS